MTRTLKRSRAQSRVHVSCATAGLPSSALPTLPSLSGAGFQPASPSHRPRRRAAAASLLALLTLAACVDRRLVITSTPPDAQVLLNDVDVGRTPLEVDFTYFGVYDIRLSKPGYEPIDASREAAAPFYEWPVVDFFALLIPTRKRTIIRWDFDLEPEVEDRDALLGRAREITDRLPPDP